MIDANQIAALGGVVTGTGAIIVGFFATRSSVKMDDLATVTKQRDEEIAARAQEAKARAKDRVELQTAHDEEIARKDRRIRELTIQVDEQYEALALREKVEFALRAYITRLLRVFAERDETPPQRPVEL
ncbi:hypothetical protein U2G91_15545 [Rhodococcoides fascians]|uniref:hypothetical protein n=1 Tax=Rhodococcoides fascians TaxID=1828 RepID=UPI002ACDE63F|nr:hypothetical protein [Rhodococcus fascians]WQH26517.1 hypothetical protein U2G91_15545 [Rhodococcus fascians]